MPKAEAQELKIEKQGPCADISTFDLPYNFKCEGEWLWGQIQTVFEGSQSIKTDDSKGMSGSDKSMKFCASVESGDWSIKKVFIKPDGEVHTNQVGYLIYNSDQDALDLVKRCAKAGFSSQGKSPNVVFINRYDWSMSHTPATKLFSALDEEQTKEDDEEDEDARSLMGYRMFFVDKKHFEPFVRCVSKNFHKHEKKCVYKLKEEDVGFHLTMEDTEYDIGYLIFNESGDKLLGFLYDGSYSVLEEGELSVEK
ncbi:Lrriq1 [Acrasis kona]|uniref:Lrriq1 n=1 Tax=Acrasis kona TaxID=1008807 RepID=A0AAW2ZBB6_9EUKA